MCVDNRFHKSISKRINDWEKIGIHKIVVINKSNLAIIKFRSMTSSKEDALFTISSTEIKTTFENAIKMCKI